MPVHTTKAAQQGARQHENAPGEHSGMPMIAGPYKAALMLHKRIGNRAFEGLIQRKSTSSQSADPREQEADWVAEAVFSLVHPTSMRGSNHLLSSLHDRSTPDAAHGRSIDSPVRGLMESLLGYDLSQVRIHSDGQAAEAAGQLSARAYALGTHIVFGAGEYAPHTETGLRLLAHELTHVVQQQPGSPAPRSAALALAPTALPLIHLSAPLAPQMKGAPPKGSPAPQKKAPAVILPDKGPVPGPGQMKESEFLSQAREILNRSGVQEINKSFPGSDPTKEFGLGDLYVAGLEDQAKKTGKSIEELVAESIETTHTTAEGYLSGLESRVPYTITKSLSDIQLMVEAPPQEETQEAGVAHYEPDPRDAGVPLPGGVPEAHPAPQAEGDLRNEFPEITPLLAAALVPMPGSIWGPLRVLLQGTIFHAIISAGYLFGSPPPPHPFALINKGGGTLGRKRTDLRDPATGAVIEVKPAGQIGGTAQLATYIATLGPPWHAALDVATEAWPVTGTRAVYQLNPFGIQLFLEAWNNFALEPGMLYYELTTKPGYPVYVPKWSQQPERKYNFRFPRIRLSEFELPVLPAPSQQAVAAATMTTGTFIMLLIAATLIPVVPPPP